MLNNATDNYFMVQQAIAKRVLANPLGSFVGYGGVGSSGHAKLVAVAAGDQSDTFGFLSVEFRRADTNCDMYIRANAKRESGLGREVDAEGNVWVEYELSVEVSWPSHGGADVATCLARLKLYQDVALLAAEILADFGGRNVIRRMVMTRSQVELAKLKEQQETFKRNIQSLVVANCKGMRVGGERKIPAELITTVSVPQGKFDVTVGLGLDGVRKYVIFVTEGNGANLQRVA